MARVLKSGGKLVMTTRGINFPKHEFPNDYYRFTGEALIQLFAMNGFSEIYVNDNTGDNGVFGHGIKV